MGERDYIFIYGTLLSGVDRRKNESLLAQATFVGEGSVNGVLYDVGHFPAMIASAKSHDRVFGEVYEFENSPAFFLSLDCYEGCDPKSPRPHLFKRCQMDVDLGGEQTLKAWAYLYNRKTDGLPRIASGDYWNFLKSRKRG